MIVLDSWQRTDWQEAHTTRDARAQVEMGQLWEEENRTNCWKGKEASLGGQDSQVKELSQYVTDMEGRRELG